MAIIDAVVLEVDLAVLHVPGAVLVVIETGDREIDSAVLNIVPVRTSGFDNAGDIEADLTVLDIPGAVLVVINAVCLEVDFALFNSPMTILIGIEAGSIEVYLTFDNIVPVGTCGLDDLGDIETDFAVLDIPGALVVLVDTVGIEVDFTVLYLPGAELVGIETVRFEVDLAVFNSPPAEAVLIDAGCLEVDFTLFNIVPTAGATEDAGLVDLIVGIIDDKIVAAVFEFLDRIVVFNDLATFCTGKEHRKQRQDDRQRQDDSYKAFC